MVPGDRAPPPFSCSHPLSCSRPGGGEAGPLGGPGSPCSGTSRRPVAAAKAHNGIREDSSSARPLRAFCSCHPQRRPHRGRPPASPASPPPWVCPAAGPLPACCGHPPSTFQLVALRLERRQEEEGDRAGRREAGRSPPGSFPLSSGIFFLSLSLPPLSRACIFGSVVGFPPLVMRTLKSAVPTIRAALAAACAQPCGSRVLHL